MKALSVFSAFTVLGLSALADPLYVEDFDYVDGELQAASGGNWLAYDGNPVLNVVSGELELDFSGSGVNGWYGTTFSSSNISSGNLFAHFDLTVDEAPAVSGAEQQLFASFWNGGSGNRARLWLGIAKDGGGAIIPDSFRLGITESSGSSSGVVWGPNIAEGSTVRVGIKYDFTTASFYVDAADENDVTGSVDDGGSFGLNGFAFRHKDEGDLGVFRVDNLVVTETYEDIIVSLPEPTPAKVAARAVPGEKIFVTWKDESNSETGFQVERSVSGGSFSVAATLDPNENFYIDSAVSVGTDYSYRVTTLGTNNSGVSTASTATPVADQTVEVVSEASLAADGSGLSLEIDSQRAVSYQAEESPDLVNWTPFGLPLGGADGTLSMPLDTPVGSTYYRINGTLYAVPENIGLTEPFQMPNNGTGETIDASTFGLTSNDSSDDDATAIQNALNSAASGDIVTLPAGTFHVKKAISVASGKSLIGAGKTETVLVAVGSLRDVLDISSGRSDITIRSLGITNDDTNQDLQYGIEIGSSSGSLVSRVWIEDVQIEYFKERGVQIRQSKHVKVENCRILNATNLGGGGNGYGVIINDNQSNNNWVTGNIIGPIIRHGVLLQYECFNNLIEYNTCMNNTEDAYDLHGEDEYNNEFRFNLAFWDNSSGWDGTPVGFGIGNTGSTHDDSGPYNWIHHNEVYGYYAGLEVILDSHIQFIDGNYFHDNTRAGIQLNNGGGDGVFIRGNIIENNGDEGISATGSNGLTVEDNTISGHDTGVEIIGSGGYSIIDNDLSGNTSATNFQSSNGTYQNNTE